MNGLIPIGDKYNNSDMSHLGGKAISLSKLLLAGFNVPSGLIIPTGFYIRYISDNNISLDIETILEEISIPPYRTIQSASLKIRLLIIDGNLSQELQKEILLKIDIRKRYAVRSSANVEDGSENTWAGQLDSYLNIEKKDIFRYIVLCWASLYSERAIQYRLKKCLESSNISIAVILQEFIPAEKSGVAFSVHPITKNNEHILIESCLGLGELLVSGKISPDSCVVDKKSLEVVSYTKNLQKKALFAKEFANSLEDTSDKKTQRTLDDEEIGKIAKEVLAIEKYYGFPCDIEWVITNSELFIVQSRPITTLI